MPIPKWRVIGMLKSGAWVKIGQHNGYWQAEQIAKRASETGLYSQLRLVAQ